MDITEEGPRQPWKALFVVSSCVAITMYTMTNLFPYVGYMVVGFRGDHVNGSGYAAGYVASAFFLGRLLSSYAWGFASDHLGRKSVMVISMVSIVIGSMFFGVSTGLLWAIIVRLLMGLTCAATIIGRAIVPELCRSAGVMEGMGLLTGGYAIGLTLGPAVGGILSDPVRYFPSLFPPDGFFARYPYVLPNVMGSLGALILIPLVILYVPETKKRKGFPEKQLPGERTVTPVSTPIRTRGGGGDYDMLAAGAGAKTSRLVASPMKEAQVTVEENMINDAESEVVEFGESNIFGELLQARHVPELLVATGLMEVLFCAGVGQALLTFVAYAWLVKWMGIEACHRGAGALAALINAAIPLIGYLRWSDQALFILSSVTIALLNAASYTLYTAVMVSATNPVPSRLRGRLAGITTAAQCLGGTIAPGAFAVLFAWSISTTSTAREIPFVNHHLVFSLGAIMRIILLALVWNTLTEDSLTNVVEDPPTPQNGRAPLTELETVRNGEEIKQESLSLTIGDKRADLV